MKLNINMLLFFETAACHRQRGACFVGDCRHCFCVTPPSPLLMGEGIRDMLRSSMAGFRHPPTPPLSTELGQPCAGLDPMWQWANRGELRGERAVALIACQQTQNTNNSISFAADHSLVFHLAASSLSALSGPHWIVREWKWAPTPVINFSLTFRKLNETLI